MRQFLINLLFSMLGNKTAQLYSIQYLFGGNVGNHEARKNRWERSLARLWKDKDLLDFLYYQAENDKEAVWRGKLSKELSQGARIRTLFIVKSAKIAYENMIKQKRSSADEKSEQDTEIKKIHTAYNQVTDID